MAPAGMTPAEIFRMLGMSPHPEGGHFVETWRDVPKGAWQTAESLGAWTLAGCTVSPAFQFEGFELAPPDWRPRPRR